MVATIPLSHTGTGLYTAREAAVFAKMRTQTFCRWFFGDVHYDAALQPSIPQSAEKRTEQLVTFIDLIQAVAVRTMRHSPKGSQIQLQHVREVVAECESQGIQYPLAREHTLYWYANRLILKLQDGTYIGTKQGIDHNQIYHGLIIEPFLKEVKFVNDYAQSWTPLENGSFRISLDADRRFGMPVVEPGGILVRALWDAVDTEGSIEKAATAFETEQEAVQLALKYREYLQSPT